MHAKTIKLFDSQGKKDDKNKFFKVIEHYMYDTLSKNTEGERQDCGAWRYEWTTTDESETSPRQENGHERGIFTLVSMGLLQNGLRSRRNPVYKGHSHTETHTRK